MAGALLTPCMVVLLLLEDVTCGPKPSHFSAVLRTRFCPLCTEFLEQLHPSTLDSQAPGGRGKRMIGTVGDAPHSFLPSFRVKSVVWHRLIAAACQHP